MRYKNLMEQLSGSRRFVFPGVEIQQTSRQNYGGYGYDASQSQDSSMYAAGAAYGASSNGYGNHQQQPVS